MVFMGEFANRVPESGHGICFRDSNGVKDSAEVDSGASPNWNAGILKNWIINPIRLAHA